MKIGVCVKDSIQPEFFEFMKINQGVLDQSTVRYGLNEFDNYAVQVAKRIKEESDGQVHVVCIGPERASKSLTEAIALGGDAAMHLVYNEMPFLHDPFCTAQLLSQAMKSEAYDLIVCGVQSVDCSTAITPMVLSELLEMTCIWNVCRIENVEKDRIVVLRELEGGAAEIIDVKLPAVLAVQSGIVPFKVPTFLETSKAKKVKIQKVDIGKLEPNIGSYSRYKTTKIYEFEAARKMTPINGDAQAIARQLMGIIAAQA